MNTMRPRALFTFFVLATTMACATRPEPAAPPPAAEVAQPEHADIATQPAEPALRADEAQAATQPPANAGGCTETGCPDGKKCLKYYGVAGARGPEFSSCEHPCVDKKSACPADQACVTIADGPGQVCRPKR